jgi:hypothetical protein
MQLYTAFITLFCLLITYYNVGNVSKESSSETRESGI